MWKLLRGGACLLALGGMTRAQNLGPLALPAPLVRTTTTESAGAHAKTMAEAQLAQDLGFPSVAAEFYRKALAAPNADRVALRLALATALLDAGEPQEAEKVLTEIPEPRNAAWHLRAGLAAVQLRKIDAARAALAAIRENEVSVEDYPWYWFFQGQIVDLAPVREISRANSFYQRAENVAMTELSRSRFQLAAERTRLEMKIVRDVDPNVHRENYERTRGTQVGYDFAETYVVTLAERGETAPAKEFLQTMLARVPRGDRDQWDWFRLVSGMMGGELKRGEPARTALNQLLESGYNPERQRQALQLLAKHSRAEPERGEFQALLQRLIDAKPDHAIKESLLLVRAQSALHEKDFVQAEADANALLKQFPLSKLKAHAYGVLTQSAWEQQRFRYAAESAFKARGELEPQAPSDAANPMTVKMAKARRQLGVLEAEARFRAGLATADKSDFRLAADTYAAVLREPSTDPGEDKGALMFQWVLAEIKSGSGEAGKLLDRLAGDPAFDIEHRWKAEVQLSRALQLQGDVGMKEAFARVNALLREPAATTAGLKSDLRARIEWLQVRLAFENGEYEQTRSFADAWLKAPRELEAWLKKEIASAIVLLKARAELALANEPEALKTLAQLRADFSDTEAAIESFLIEAEHYVAQEKIDTARTKLLGLTDNQQYQQSRYVPYALYRLASLSEGLGRKENLEEAVKRLEDILKKPAAAGQADLIFAARLKQGDIFRKLNDFTSAERAYEQLVIQYPRRPDVVFAQLKLAECHNVQSGPASGGDQTHADTAQLLFEQLRDRVDAPLDVRAEAGYNLGKLLERRGKVDEAARVWAEDVVEALLKRNDPNPTQPDAGQTEAKRPYWYARTLRDLGELQEKRGRLNEARAAYRLLLELRLPYGAVAKSKLDQLGGAAIKTGQ